MAGLWWRRALRWIAVMLRLAGRRHWYAARLEHLGRRTGHVYAIPVVLTAEPDVVARPPSAPGSPGADRSQVRAAAGAWPCRPNRARGTVEHREAATEGSRS